MPPRYPDPPRIIPPSGRYTWRVVYGYPLDVYDWCDTEARARDTLAGLQFRLDHGEAPEIITCPTCRNESAPARISPSEAPADCPTCEGLGECDAWRASDAVDAGMTP